ncbi:MAG TPA: hypothetical protein O0W79_01790 [Methanocorpusculum sp.]|nr:hypothetical protein [Methanocorpusculum sp.]
MNLYLLFRGMINKFHHVSSNIMEDFGTVAMKFIDTEFASHCTFFSVETPSEKADNQEQRLARIRLYERLGYRISGIEMRFAADCR